MREEANDQMDSIAHRDALTGLPNRLAFDEYLADTVAQAEREQGQVALLLINISRFGEINEVLGRMGGNRALMAITRHLQGGLRDGEWLARLSGTHFAVVQRTHDHIRTMHSLTERIAAVLDFPLTVDSHSVKAGFNAGIAAFPVDSSSAEHLFANADLALSRAQMTGSQSICYFDSSSDHATRRRRVLTQDLRYALDRKQFELYFQPQYDVHSLAIVGAEGLLRWRHPLHGMVSPAEFIPIAEEIGLINGIGEWVLREGCRIAASWDMPLKVALNLSPLQFRSPDLVGTVQTALHASGLTAQRLELEVTELTLIQNPERVMSDLGALSELGISIALDDFGAGYSSLGTLAKFPFSKIKLDRSFLQDNRSIRQSEAVIRAVLTLGRTLGILILAEGVETAEQLAFLEAEGCDQLQGYLLGRPMPENEFRELIAPRVAASGFVPGLVSDLAPGHCQI